jgi:predicted TIM-barrel fold metal-dependent hydrolase
MHSRRQFLVTSAATAAALPLLNQVARAAEDDDCIDAHVHVWTPDTEHFPLAKGYTKADMVPPSFTPEELFAQCRPVGVAQIVLIQMSFYGFDNRYMLSVMEKHPNVFSGVAIIDETQDDAPQKMKSLAAKGVRGFRLYADKQKTAAWSSSAGMKRMWSTAADTGQAMCLLANPDALSTIYRMVEQYPQTRVVIDHFARVGMSGKIDPTELDNLCRLAKFENVFVKTSAFYALNASLRYLAEVGIEAIGRHADPLVAELDAGLRELGLEPMCPYDPELPSGIIAFQHPRSDAIQAALLEKQVHVMHHAGRLRVAIHGYNTADDIQQLVEVLQASV